MFKNQGMDKDSMLKNLEKIKNQCDFKAKDGFDGFNGFCRWLV